ncbi:MAG: hypothetical protein P8184_15575 [Calditrichia bacterium]
MDCPLFVDWFSGRHDFEVGKGFPSYPVGVGGDSHRRECDELGFDGIGSVKGFPSAGWGGSRRFPSA